MARARQYPCTSMYHNAYCLPSVNQMMTAGGAGYNDPTTMSRVFPLGPTSRIQTPINRVGAFIMRFNPAVRLSHRGGMWCR